MEEKVFFFFDLGSAFIKCISHSSLKQQLSFFSSTGKEKACKLQKRAFNLFQVTGEMVSFSLLLHAEY